MSISFCSLSNVPFFLIPGQAFLRPRKAGFGMHKVPSLGKESVPMVKTD